MADFRTLCAELVDWAELLVEIPDPPVTRNALELSDLLARCRAALAEPAEPAKNCWLDDEPGIWPSPCVFEDHEEVIGNCVYASVLNSEGKCKTDCKYYRQPTSEGDFDDR